MNESCHRYKVILVILHTCMSALVWHDAFTCMTWPIHVCGMTLSAVELNYFPHVWRDTFTCESCRIRVCDMIHVTHVNASCHTNESCHTCADEWIMSHMRWRMNHVTHAPFMSHTWMSHVTRINHVTHAAFVCVTWFIRICVWHDSSTCVPWRIYMCEMTHANVCHDSFTRGTCPTRETFHLKHLGHVSLFKKIKMWVPHVCAMTHSHDSHGTYPSYMLQLIPIEFIFSKDPFCCPKSAQ